MPLSCVPLASLGHRGGVTDARPQHPSYDAVVVGGGTAGLSAALWIARYRRRTLVLDTGEPRNRAVDQSWGYFSRDGVNPGELLVAARADLDAYDEAERCSLEATAVRGAEGDFVVDTGDGRSVKAQRVVLAYGVVDEVPDVEGFDTHYGASVFHCQSCDGYLARDRDIAVIGWTEAVAGFALELLDWAASVTVVGDGHRFEGDERERSALARHGVARREETAVAFEGERGDLQCLRMSGGPDVACSMAFFSIAHHPRSTLADALGCAKDEEGYLVVDEHGETSVPGVFAAGDITPGFQLLNVAAAKGVSAGVSCALSLRREPPLPGEPERAPDIPMALDEEPEWDGDGSSREDGRGTATRGRDRAPG